MLILSNLWMLLLMSLLLRMKVAEFWNLEVSDKNLALVGSSRLTMFRSQRHSS